MDNQGKLSKVHNMLEKGQISLIDAQVYIDDISRETSALWGQYPKTLQSCPLCTIGMVRMIVYFLRIRDGSVVAD